MADWREPVLERLDRTTPILIAGPTASGKSALALRIAQDLGGRIINADALQVYADWRILTARPTPTEEASVPHALYGHVPGDRAYSVGTWVAEVSRLMDGPRPIVVGGTGLYFSALTEGLAVIPPTPPDIRKKADERMRTQGMDALLGELDPETSARIDRLNPMRIQRAWEVQATTGTGLAAWQDNTGPPLLDLGEVVPLVLEADRDWLAGRIEKRFEMMLEDGLLEEARANAPDWAPERPSAKAIGASEIISHVNGQEPLDTVREKVVTLTRQYAKRQRSWFRGRMKSWQWVRCH